MSGVIQDGWEYVTYAWSFSAAGLIGYALYVGLQLSRAKAAFRKEGP